MPFLSSLAYSLTTDQSVYQVGQPIELTFTETNTSDQPVTVEVSPADFTISQNNACDLAVRPGRRESASDVRNAPSGTIGVAVSELGWHIYLFSFHAKWRGADHLSDQRFR